MGARYTRLGLAARWAQIRSTMNAASCRTKPISDEPREYWLCMPRKYRPGAGPSPWRDPGPRPVLPGHAQPVLAWLVADPLDDERGVVSHEAAFIVERICAQRAANPRRV